MTSNTPALEALKYVLCDPEGRVVITGDIEDRIIIQRALTKLDASIILDRTTAENVLNYVSGKHTDFENMGWPTSLWVAVHKFKDGLEAALRAASNEPVSWEERYSLLAADFELRGEVIADQSKQIAELEAEIERLKSQLAPDEKPVAWRSPQPSETHPWAFTWDEFVVRMWKELLPEYGPIEPLYLHPQPQSDVVKALEGRIVELENALKAERHRATNAEYMRDFCRQLLGPIASEQVENMILNGVKRVHVSWGPDAMKMTGEERAAQYKAFSEAPREEIKFNDSFEALRTAGGEHE